MLCRRRSHRVSRGHERGRKRQVRAVELLAGEIKNVTQFVFSLAVVPTAVGLSGPFAAGPSVRHPYGEDWHHDCNGAARHDADEGDIGHSSDRTEALQSAATGL